MKYRTNSKTAFGLLIWGAGVALALNLQGADPKVDIGKLPPPVKKKDVSFDKDIKAIYDKSCVKCHSGEKAKGDLRLDTREGALKGGEGGPAIVAGKSDQSHLVFYVADLVPDMEMPPLPKRGGFPALTKEQVGLVRAWIDQGAK
jgi:mono/diheme cytochrome c family protein